MKHNYNIPAILSSLTGQKISQFSAVSASGQEAEKSDAKPRRAGTPNRELLNGRKLYNRDFRGRWYFMPVYIKHKDLDGSPENPELEGRNMIELQNAVVKITGKKTIVETPMVGRKGTVKEAINTNEFRVVITAFVQSQDGTYPEAQISQIKKLYGIDESVELICALTDLVFDEDHKVVITDIEFPTTPNVEDGQGVIITCITDKDFELIMPI